MFIDLSYKKKGRSSHQIEICVLWSSQENCKIMSGQRFFSIKDVFTEIFSQTWQQHIKRKILKAIPLKTLSWTTASSSAIQVKWLFLNRKHKQSSSTENYQLSSNLLTISTTNLLVLFCTTTSSSSHHIHNICETIQQWKIHKEKFSFSFQNWRRHHLAVHKNNFINDFDVWMKKKCQAEKWDGNCSSKRVLSIMTSFLNTVWIPSRIRASIN